MIRTGLISVTFRRLDPESIVSWASRANLSAIEWGGDVHVPHGDVQRARLVGCMTREAGLNVCSYGSYYRVGCGAAGNAVDFERVLETAVALQAPAIRVWAGDRGSEAADEAWRRQVAEDARRIAELSASAGVRIDFEYHSHTLTDTTESALSLLSAIDHPNVRCHWQPRIQDDFAQSCAGLEPLLSRLANVHVFHWLPSGERRPLHEGEERWRRYLSALLPTGSEHYALLEFVKDDDPMQMMSDAETLHRILDVIGAAGSSRA